MWIPRAKSMKIELYNFKAVFLLNRAPRRYPGAIVFPLFPRNGPIAVMLEKIGEVCGVEAEPDASLSDSKPSEVETDGLSARFGSRTINPNCTFPRYPKSVSKSSSRLRYETK